MPDNKNGIRRGLVLEGGGAKGAWQYGVLKAFYDHGVEFDVVSGTSVGALNGAIWASGRFDIGDSLWSFLHRSRVFSIHIVIVPLILLGILSRIYYSYLHGYFTKDTPKALAICFKLITDLPIFIILLWFLISAIIDRQWLISVIFIIAIFYLRNRVTNMSLDHRRKIFYMSFASFIVILLFAIYGIIKLQIATLISTLGLISICICALPYVLISFAFLFRTLNISLFGTSPLESVLTKIIIGKFKIPLFAATGILEPKYFDPDDIEYASSTSGTQYDTQVTYHAVPKSSVIPDYQRVDLLSSEQALIVLLASSALPLGITPWRHSQSTKKLVDGGVIDNIPWFPLVELDQCDELVIVGCNPLPKWNDVHCCQQWKDIDRKLRVVNTDPNLYDFCYYSSMENVKNNPPIEVPMREPNNWPKRVILISPIKPLGSFISGTINFSKKVAEQNLKDGYVRGLEIISSGLLT